MPTNVVNDSRNVSERGSIEYCSFSATKAVTDSSKGSECASIVCCSFSAV